MTLFCNDCEQPGITVPVCIEPSHVCLCLDRLPLMAVLPGHKLHVVIIAQTVAGVLNVRTSKPVVRAPPHPSSLVQPYKSGVNL